MRWFLGLPSLRNRILAVIAGTCVALVIAFEWNPPSSANADVIPIRTAPRPMIIRDAVVQNITALPKPPFWQHYHREYTWP